jgi:putative transposase
MAYDSVGAARVNIAQYFDRYNTERPHSSLDRVTPKQVYEDLLPKLAEAA